VETYVCEHNDALIAEAIRRELRRGGQVIYLYNRTETMERVAAELSLRLPDARIIVAHGKMEREELEDSWASLVRGEVDIIICTTIVETGVDLPRANTLIVEDADRLGLSQLHQLRGRVGRSGRQAYAYFTFRRGKSLSEIATKRLSAIREYAAFGAGFQIALRDLEIRGAGNLLGAEQHGNIEAVGYELYVRLLSEALIEEKGEVTPPPPETVIELSTDAHIPEKYIARAPSRMEMYKKISAIATVEDAKDIYEEFCDRFGRPPRAVENLLCVSLARALGTRLGFARISMRGGAICFQPRELDLAPWSVLFAEGGALKFAKSAPPCVLYTPDAKEPPARAAVALLVRYARACATDDEKGETK
jgi:transcription-repair coupling factor (superfamily II helicase)